MHILDEIYGGLQISYGKRDATYEDDSDDEDSDDDDSDDDWDDEEG